MSISEFIAKLYGAGKHTFYLNDKIVDLAELYNNYATITGFEIDDKVILLYAKDNDDNE